MPPAAEQRPNLVDADALTNQIHASLACSLERLRIAVVKQKRLDLRSQ
jgi:hypothetical protein